MFRVGSLYGFELRGKFFAKVEKSIFSREIRDGVVVGMRGVFR